MNTAITQKLLRSALVLALAAAWPCVAFDSGSTGADGAFSPVADIDVELPENGILNYTTFNVPEGVTVRFRPNMANTPAVVLVQGDAVIDGVIDLNGYNGNQLIRVTPPGGYAGGDATPRGRVGENGAGPGGGLAGFFDVSSGDWAGGGGASYQTKGENGVASRSSITAATGPVAGQLYGGDSLQPLIGGSGGAAGTLRISSNELRSDAGGSGGGALLLAVTGELALNGTISARGGEGGNLVALRADSGGAGGGSGGAVRLIASIISGEGSLDLRGGGSGSQRLGIRGGSGGVGRGRLEADEFEFSGTVQPINTAATFNTPRSLFLPNMPQIRIASIAGQNVPPVPSGRDDIQFSSVSNPVAVVIVANNVPVENPVTLTVLAVSGQTISVTGPGLQGNLESSTTTFEANLPDGDSILTASVSFAPPGVMANALSQFTGGEAVVWVELSNVPGMGAAIKMTTENGRQVVRKSIGAVMPN